MVELERRQDSTVRLAGNVARCVGPNWQPLYGWPSLWPPLLERRPSRFFHASSEMRRPMSTRSAQRTLNASTTETCARAPR
jgi:hypothetical protein